MFFNLFLFLLCISVCVLVHELGHFLAAKFSGIKVREFSIGLGPKLFSYTDTSNVVWKLSLIPIGGYIKIGENDRIESSFKYNLWKRLIVIFFGPIGNFLFSLFLFCIIFMFFGVINYSKVSFFSVDLNENYQIVSQEKLNHVLSVVGNDNNGRTNFNTKEIESFLFDDLSSGENKLGYIRVESKVDKDITYYSLFPSIYHSFKKVSFIIYMNFLGLYSSVFGGSDSEIIGPIGMVTYSITGLFSLSSLESFLNFTAMISIAVGVANLVIPVFPLDGGMIILNIIERISWGKYKKYMIYGFVIFSWIIFSLLLSYIMYSDIKKIFSAILY